MGDDHALTRLSRRGLSGHRVAEGNACSPAGQSAAGLPPATRRWVIPLPHLGPTEILDVDENDVLPIDPGFPAGTPDGRLGGRARGQPVKYPGSA